MEEFLQFQELFSDCATVTHTLGSCLVLSGREKWVQQETALNRGQVAELWHLNQNWGCAFFLYMIF